MTRQESAAFAWNVAGQIAGVIGVLAIVLIGLALLGEIRK